MFKKRVVKEQQILNINNENEQKQKQDKKQDTKLQNDPKQNIEQGLDQQYPHKKVKLDNSSILPKNLLASSTTQNKQKKQQQLHNEFKNLAYSSGNQSVNTQQRKNQTKQLLLEQQLAKKKYMQNINSTKDVKQGKVDTKVYRGINNYANYALTQDQIVHAEQKFRKIQGPSRVSSTIRNTCRFDYNFGLCKDWHDSGYCPFGDSCIYLHDRSNYKTGWEQEKDFERAEKERWRRINNPELAQKQQIEQTLKSIQKYKISQNCQKCKNAYKNPVQVECGHIFCTGCAVLMTKCITCNKILGGIMNNATKKMQKMKQTYQELKTKILKQHEESKVKRKRYENLDSQNVFAD